MATQPKEDTCDRFAEALAFDRHVHSWAGYDYGRLLAGHAECRALTVEVRNRLLQWREERSRAFKEWQRRTGHSYISTARPQQRTTGVDEHIDACIASGDVVYAEHNFIFGRI
jgi:hypothetical protein